GRARAEDAAEQARDGGTEKRKEDDGAVHASAFHQVDVFHRDGAAVAEVDDEDGKTDGRFGGGDGEYEEREHLPHQIAQIGRERHQVDVDREQKKFDRHQHDDHVLAIHEDAEHADGEDDGGNREI